MTTSTYNPLCYQCGQAHCEDSVFCSDECLDEAMGHPQPQSEADALLSIEWDPLPGCGMYASEFDEDDIPF